MTLNTREASTVFTMLCYMIKDNVMLTDSELQLYHRFRKEGWEDVVNKQRDLMKEMLDA